MYRFLLFSMPSNEPICYGIVAACCCVWAPTRGGRNSGWMRPPFRYRPVPARSPIPRAVPVSPGVCLGAAQLQNTLEALADRVGALEVQEHLCTMPWQSCWRIWRVSICRWLKRVHFPGLTSLGLASMQHPEPGRFIAMLAASRADSLILLPAISWGGWWPQPRHINYRLGADLLAVGGGKSGHQLLAQADALGLPVYEGYGLSEVGSVVALNGPDCRRRRKCGETPVPSGGHTGRRWRDPGPWQSMLGYIGSPALPQTDSWLATGDWGEWDADGFLTIQGRKKSTLVTGFGRNVAPEWLEAELATLPRSCSALCMAMKNGIRALLFAPALAGTHEGESLLQACNARLPDYARLRGLAVHR